MRHLENQTLKDIPQSVTFECEITKVNCKLNWLHEGSAIYAGDKYEIEMDGKVHRWDIVYTYMYTIISAFYISLNYNSCVLCVLWQHIFNKAQSFAHFLAKVARKWFDPGGWYIRVVNGNKALYFIFRYNNQPVSWTITWNQSQTQFPHYGMIIKT